MLLLRRVIALKLKITGGFHFRLLYGLYLLVAFFVFLQKLLQLSLLTANLYH